MRFTRLILQNWRNFKAVDVALRERMFIVGPNASGKSNLIDAFRFLRDIAEPQGGFQKAVDRRDGVSRLRSLHARRPPEVIVDVAVDLDGQAWRYHLAFSQDNNRRPIVKAEKVWEGEQLVLDRPSADDEADAKRLGQTHLEQVNANVNFRVLAEFFSSVRYLHIVPQLIREPERWARTNGSHDPLGSEFLEQLARMQKAQPKMFESRLRRINHALRVAVPQLTELRVERDDGGRPHLIGRYKHWRPDAGWQSEAQLSDGTLRLLGLLWAVFEAGGPLLLEEPELSLHEAVVAHLPGLISRATRSKRKGRRQVVISTHSSALLSDRSIAAEEVLLLEPTDEDTVVVAASTIEDVKALLTGGLSVGEAVLARVAPASSHQLMLKFTD